MDEIQLGYRQEAAPTTVAGVDLSWRRYSNEWAAVETNRIYDFAVAFGLDPDDLNIGLGPVGKLL